MTYAAAPPAFAGWHRASGQRAWQKLTEGHSEFDVLRTLLDIIHELPTRGGDSIVLPADRRPAERQRH